MGTPNFPQHDFCCSTLNTTTLHIFSFNFRFNHLAMSDHKKIIVIPAHTRVVPGPGSQRYFVSETAYNARACCVTCVLWDADITTPLPEDFDSRGIAYVLPPGAKPIHPADIPADGVLKHAS